MFAVTHYFFQQVCLWKESVFRERDVLCVIVFREIEGMSDSCVRLFLADFSVILFCQTFILDCFVC